MYSFQDCALSWFHVVYINRFETGLKGLIKKRFGLQTNFGADDQTRIAI